MTRPDPARQRRNEHVHGHVEKARRVLAAAQAQREKVALAAVGRDENRCGFVGEMDGVEDWPWLYRCVLDKGHKGPHTVKAPMG